MDRGFAAVQIVNSFIHDISFSRSDILFNCSQVFHMNTKNKTLFSER